MVLFVLQYQEGNDSCGRRGSILLICNLRGRNAGETPGASSFHPAFGAGETKSLVRVIKSVVSSWRC